MAVAEMEIRDLLGPNANAVTRLEYLEILPATIDDKVFTPEGAQGDVTGARHEHPLRCRVRGSLALARDDGL